MKGTKEDLVAIAAALEKGSEHPLAEAITTYASEHQLTDKTASDFKALFGRGIQAVIDGKTYYAGNTRLMDEAISTPKLSRPASTLWPTTARHRSSLPTTRKSSASSP